jgi:hippurate hydrolase
VLGGVEELHSAHGDRRLAQGEGAGRLAELPTNHDPRFAPVLETEVETLLAGARAWLAS